jgi:hypothetical protein
MKNKKDVEPASYATFERGRGREIKNRLNLHIIRNVWEAKKTYFAFCY